MAEDDVPAVIPLACWSIEMWRSHCGWTRPCSQPSEFHGLSIITSAWMSSRDSSLRNEAWKCSLTALWSAHA